MNNSIKSNSESYSYSDDESSTKYSSSNNTESDKNNSESINSSNKQDIVSSHNTEKKKRGRKPKPKSIEVSPKLPKKRGRKPKPKSVDTTPKIPKKRGRKPKPKTDDSTLTKAPKKRGRKPKEKSYYIVKNEKNTDIQSDNIILHLPINSKNVIQNSKEAELLTYNPNINEPEAWQADIVGGNPIDSVAYIDNDNCNINSNTNCTQTNYSHYPFDEKENDIVNALIDSDEETEINEDLISKNSNNTDFKNNIVDDTLIEHKDKWFENNPNIRYSNKVNKMDTYQEIITIMKEKRRKDIENFSNKTTENQVEPMLIQFKECSRTFTWPSSTSIYCWWCCHPFEGAPCGLPYKYIDNKFEVYGVYCSPECAAAYNFDNYEGEDIWERYSLLNFLYRKIYNEKNIKIKLAAPRQVLKIFGGSLSIKDFRSQNSNYNRSFKVIVPPMVSIIPQQEYNFLDNGFSSKINKKYIPIEKNKIVTSEELRLKRSKPFQATKNTLEKCMGLEVN